MSATWLRAVVLIVVVLSVGATGRANEYPDFGTYHALVIGNNDYTEIAELETAVSDAAAVAELLRGRYAFERVDLLLNAKRADILRALNRLRAELTESDRLLIYYAGHGYLDRQADIGYWLPVDAEEDDDTNWISNARLTSYLKTMSARHVIVVADSCYSGTLVRSTTAGPRVGAERRVWLKRMAERRARTALVSGGLEPVVDSGAGGHSVFANAFLDALRENDVVLDGQALFERIKSRVVLNADQTPRYDDVRNANHEGGDFLFVPTGFSAAAGAGASARDAYATFDERQIELAFWDSIKASEIAADFEAYLAQFPDGQFAVLARLRIERLTAMAPQQTALLPPSKPEVELAPVEAVFIALKNANVRALPSVKSERVATLPSGTTIHVAGRVKGDDWLAVERDGKLLGYVYAPLLQDAEERRADDEKRQQEAGDAAEIAFWQSISDSENADDYRAYLETYPSGKFAAVARVRLDTYADRVALVSPAKPLKPKMNGPTNEAGVPAVGAFPRYPTGGSNVKWKMQSAFGSTLQFLGVGAKRLTRNLEERSNGQIRIKFFEPGALVPALELLPTVGAGALEAGFTSSSYHELAMGSKAPYFFYAVPFGLEGWRQFEWVRQGEGRALYDELYSAHGVKSLPCGLLGPEGVGWFRSPIRTVDDLRGLKMRFFGLGSQVMQKIGVSPQLLAGADIYPALERGVIDATEFSVPAIDVTLGFHEVVKYYYYPAWHQRESVWELIVARSEWDELTAPQQNFIEEMCVENAAWMWKEEQAQRPAALENLKRRGVKISRFPHAITVELEAAWREVAAEEAAKDPMFRRVYEAYQRALRRAQ